MLSMNQRCRNRYAATTGTTRTMAAASCTARPPGPAAPPMRNTVSSCGRVMSPSSRMTRSGHSTSFHEPMNTNRPTMASGGPARGQNTVKMMRSSPMPSRRAASMSERGTCRKNWRRIRMPVTLNRYGTISAA